MRNYDGVHACQQDRAAIEASGYVQAFTTIDRDQPEDVKAAGPTGWDKRRAIKAWAREEGITDFVIFRASDYLRDLHGRSVYEVYVPRRAS